MKNRVRSAVGCIGFRLFRVVVFALLAAGPGRGHAQPSPVPRVDAWQPDGPVLALAVDGTTAYLGGSFEYLGPASGSAGVVGRPDGAVAGAFPAIDGTVQVMVADGAGGWFVGGSFTERASRHTQLLHVDADGSVDPAWRPEVQGTVHALLLRGGTLYVGGDFTRIDGQDRPRMARFDFPSGALSAWNPAPNEEVLALVGDETRLYVGGAFTSFARQSRARVAAVDLATGTVTAFNPGASGSGAIVRALALSGNTLYVGGRFTTCGGKPRTALAAVNTLADTGNALDWNPGAGGDVYSLLVMGSTVYAGGDFTTIGGANRSRIAALDTASNAALAGWNPGANGIVYALAAEADGLLVGGAFTTLGGRACAGVGRLDPASGALLPWAPLISMLAPTGNPVVHSVVPAGERIAVGGAFASLGGVARMRLAAVDLGSGLPTAWNPGASGDVLALAVSGSSVFAGGRFTNVAGVARTRLASLDRATGSANPFTANVTASGNNGVNALLYSEPRLYVGGGFSAVNGQARANLAEVTASDGTLNTNWNPAPNGAVLSLALGGTNLYVGGSFATLGGSNRTFLGVVGTAGSGRATAVQPRANNDVRALALSDRSLYVGGDFDNLGGAPRRRFAVLDTATGDAVATWNPDVASPSGSYSVQAIALSGRGAYVGGVFTTAGGEFRTRLAGIHRSDAIATAWNPGANAVVRRLVYATDRLLAAGDFTQIGGQSVGYFAVFRTEPFIPAGGLRIGADGVPEVTVWEGDVPSTTLTLQTAEGAAGSVWTDRATQEASGRPKVFRDPDAATLPSRCYRAVAR